MTAGFGKWRYLHEAIRKETVGKNRLGGGTFSCPHRLGRVTRCHVLKSVEDAPGHSEEGLPFSGTESTRGGAWSSQGYRCPRVRKTPQRLGTNLAKSLTSVHL